MFRFNIHLQGEHQYLETLPAVPLKMAVETEVLDCEQILHKNCTLLVILFHPFVLTCITSWERKGAYRVQVETTWKIQK